MTIINVSGGLDSTFAAWNYMVKNPDKKLLIHHCTIKKVTKRYGRHEFEEQAFDNIIDYFKANDFNFELYRTSISFDAKAEVLTNDQYLVNACLGLMCFRSNIKVTTILVPISKTDINNGYGYANSNNKRAKKIKQLRDMFLKKAKTLYPIEHLTRKEMLEKLPKDLVKLLYFCQGFHRTTSEPCGECDTCLETLPFL